MRLIGSPTDARALRVRLVAPDGSVHLPTFIDEAGRVHFDAPIAGGVLYLDDVAVGGTSATTAYVTRLRLRDREEFAAALRQLRSRAGVGLRDIARTCGRPPTTVHGWFAGRHLPYPRDNEGFTQMLRYLGVEDLHPWQEALTRLRGTHPTDSGLSA